jgi:uncharacterized membrane protein YgaE (UPF0421/DUF939 family)
MALPLALQAGAAAGISWFVAHDLVGHRSPFFAPIAAVTVLAVSLGHRLRRATEMVFGVALGIAVGDGLILLIGTGPVQIAAVVSLAILLVVFLRGGPTVVSQAASSAVLVATLAPPSGGIYYTRFFDSFIGGVVGLLVMALLLPMNPLTVVKRAANIALDIIADGLTATAAAIRDGDVGRAEQTLEHLRGTDPQLVGFREALAAGRETVTLAPVRWRSRGALAQYVDAAEHLERALRNLRVLTRRSVALLSYQEPAPPDLARGLDTLAKATITLRDELAAAREPVAARQLIVEAVREGVRAYHQGLGFSGDVVVAQIRSMGVDLLRGTGLPGEEADRVVRRAIGRPTPPAVPDSVK